MATLLESIREKAKKMGRKIVLTESDDPRNLIAASKMAQTAVAKPVLVGDADAIKKLAAENNISLDGVEIVDVLKTPNLQKYIDLACEIRKNKGLTPEQAREWLKDTCVFAAVMVCAGDAHGYVSGGGNPKGYNHNTAGKTRPALQLFKTAPGMKSASACSGSASRRCASVRFFRRTESARPIEPARPAGRHALPEKDAGKKPARRAPGGYQGKH